MTTTTLTNLSGDYTIDTAHSRIGFVARHAMVTKVRGQFADYTATAHIDTENPAASSVEVTINVASISTGSPDRDGHLRSADFFDAEKYPTASFVSTGVTAAGEGQLKVAGDLTIHGVTRPVVLDVTINKVGEHPMAKTPAAGFDARTVIKRSDFGVGGYAPAVSDEVTIEITVESRLAK